MYGYMVGYEHVFGYILFLNKCCPDRREHYSPIFPEGLN